MSDWQPPGFRVKFMTEMFDHSQSQGLGVTVRQKSGPLEHKRHAIRIRDIATPAMVAHALREMADWIESNSGEAAS